MEGGAKRCQALHVSAAGGGRVHVHPLAPAARRVRIDPRAGSGRGGGRGGGTGGVVVGAQGQTALTAAVGARVVGVLPGLERLVVGKIMTVKIIRVFRTGRLHRVS